MHEELLHHQAFLERLARRLAADDAAAEDLRQETWLRALTAPPRERAALRAWLQTVARRLAWRKRRGDERRRARERCVARKERQEDGVADVDRRLDAQAILLERLRALSEPQRVTLTLRYADELGPAEIAAQLGVSVNTVNTVKARLRRGLHALRDGMDRASDGGRSSWVRALIPGAVSGSAGASA